MTTSTLYILADGAKICKLTQIVLRAGVQRALVPLEGDMRRRLRSLLLEVVDPLRYVARREDGI